MVALRHVPAPLVPAPSLAPPREAAETRSDSFSTSSAAPGCVVVSRWRVTSSVLHYGASTRIPEVDLCAFTARQPRIGARWVFGFLAEHGMFTPTPPAPGADERWVRHLLVERPSSIRTDLDGWRSDPDPESACRQVGLIYRS